ncbi:Holliday junction ATP-dependent DNA helicase RuvB [Candidatus Clavichlamydia salmonicola]|uniref:Holliday junction branch migration DNA helicase RuvB n=1 Tax=Candidatus Clavichlamydia salmonicola TaxID=469812 RepID=UPI00189162B1|nr:Holliday junction branch migration DNA helicase RuvB [Candidatus Clavichlamydia salmonicola]MBF5051146.1 Holliday junction ATP-dependent DNA helicase RuvB [Candidatus Clavichlamydia salmonicola]
MENHFIGTIANEKSFESALRPCFLEDFWGQNDLKERLEVFIGAAHQRNETLGHCLFYGPPGLGKTTLAHILAKKVGHSLVSASGPQLEKPADLVGILTNLQEKDVFFVDEIHRMSRAAEEYLYSAMEDYYIDLMLDSGPNARSVRVSLSKFTLIGATTKVGMLSAPLRSRFMFTGRLEYYPSDVLAKVIMRSAALLQLEISQDAFYEIAIRARGTPRVANRLLRWVRDFAQMKSAGKIDREVAVKALKMLSIDDWGLDEIDAKILSTIIGYYEGGPVGLNTLAVAVGEEPRTIEEVYEPFLILKGLLKRTPRGRMVTELAYTRESNFQKEKEQTKE